MQTNGLEMETKALQMQTVKVFIVGADMLREDFFNLASNIREVEIVGGTDCADNGTGETIVRLQPQVVIHDANASEEDRCLIETVAKELPRICYIALGDISNLMFRIRCNASGANYVLDRRNGLNQVLKILRSEISKHNEDYTSHRHSGNGGKNKPEVVEHVERDTIHSLPNPDLDKFFSMMNNSPFSLLFADRGLTLRHVNPVASVALKTLEQFLPTKVEYLIGQPIDIFHRQPGIIRKIIGNPGNLPYQTQFIIGPKTLDLQVSVARGGDNHYLGCMARWTEITEPEF